MRGRHAVSKDDRQGAAGLGAVALPFAMQFTGTPGELARRRTRLVVASIVWFLTVPLTRLDSCVHLMSGQRRLHSGSLIRQESQSHSSGRTWVKLANLMSYQGFDVHCTVEVRALCL
jgi:hypothetical protein